MSLASLFRRLLGRGPAQPPPKAALSEEDRRAFSQRYLVFKLLLNANNCALRSMGAMSGALAGPIPYGITYVRALCTEAGTNVYSLIRLLNELCGGRYTGLYERFAEIQGRIDAGISPRREALDDPLVLPLPAPPRCSRSGASGRPSRLLEAAQGLDLAVAPGVLITPAAFHSFMERNDLQPEISRRIQLATLRNLRALCRCSESLCNLIRKAPLPPELERDLAAAVVKLLPGAASLAMYAVPSIGSPTAAAVSALFPPVRGIQSPEDAVAAYHAMLTAKYAPEAMLHRMSRGIRGDEANLGVWCARVPEAAVSGVCLSRDPSGTEPPGVLMSLCPVQQGVEDLAAQEYLWALPRDPLGQQAGLESRRRLRGENPSGPPSPIPDDARLEALARVSRRAEARYGGPVVLEWTADKNGAVTLLHCRPQCPEQPHPVPDILDSTPFYSGGLAASPGLAAGSALRLDTARPPAVPPGSLLVAQEAQDAYAPLLALAGGLLAERGSLTGRLAAVARAFGVPALFGLSGLDEVRDGELLSLNALSGEVRRLTGPPPACPRLRLSPPPGSPVHAALQHALDQIAPLSFLDPDSTHFRAENCRTLRDIAQFCHEKAVDAMFQFGENIACQERAVKRLFCKVPMQFWVMNLDDGLLSAGGTQYVQLQDIASIPMLALWHGMTAIPWEGPPAMDGKGFMSILIRSSANPALDPAVNLSMAVRNYFMISKNYCHLRSRFGFHFSSVEALVGERTLENCLSFQLKGGAADEDRRIRRVRFTAEILERYGFDTQLHADSLTARLEGYDQAVMEDRLHILGYLTMHTRQLDMVMADEASVQHYRNKLIQDIETRLQAGAPAPRSRAAWSQDEEEPEAASS